MKVSYLADVIHSKEKGDFYVIYLALVENGEVVARSKPLLWLTKETYEKYTSK